MAERIAPWQRFFLLFSIVLAWGIAAAHQSDGTSLLLGRYSSRYALALAAYSTIAILFIGLLVFAPQRCKTLLMQFTQSHPDASTLMLALGLGLLWAFPMETPLKIFPSWVGLASVILLTELFTTRGNERRWWIFIGLFAAFLLLLQLLVLIKLPIWQTHDEGVYASIAIEYPETGRISGDVYGYPSLRWSGWGSWLILLSAWYEAVGFGAFTGRLFSYLASLLALGILYGAARSWFDKRTAWVAVVLAAASYMFVETHRIRPDAITLLAVSASLWAFCVAYQHKKPWQYLLLGFLAGLSIEAHLTAPLFVGAYGLVLLEQWFTESRRTKQWRFPFFGLYMLIGVIPPVAFYAFNYIFPEFEQARFFFQYSTLAEPFNPWRYLGAPLLLIEEYSRTFPSDIIVLGIAIFLIAQSRQHKGGVMLALLAMSILMYVLVNPREYEKYIRYLLPFTVFIMASLFSSQNRRPLSTRALAVFMTVLAGAFTFAGLREAPALVQNGIGNFGKSDIVRYIEDNIPDGETIVIDMIYYPEFSHPDIYFTLNSFPDLDTVERLGGPKQGEYWQTVQPAIIVYDPRVDVYNPDVLAFVDEANYKKLSGFGALEVYVRPKL